MRFESIKASEKVPDSPRPYGVSLGIPLRLYVNSIETEGILVNNTIDAPVTRAANERLTNIRNRTAIAHLDQKLNHQTLKKSWRPGTNT